MRDGWAFALVLSAAMALPVEAASFGPRVFDLCATAGTTKQEFQARVVRTGWREVTLDPALVSRAPGREMSPEDLAAIHAVLLNGVVPDRSESWVKKVWRDDQDAELLLRHFRGDIERVYYRDGALFSMGLHETRGNVLVHCGFIGPGWIADFPYAARRGLLLQTSHPIRFYDVEFGGLRHYHGRLAEVDGIDASRIFETEIPDLALFMLTFVHEGRR